VEVLVLSDDGFALIGESSATSEGVVVDKWEDNWGDSAVSNSQVVTSNKVFAVVSKNLVEVFDEVSQILDVVGLLLFAELLAHLVRVEFANKIISEVHSIVSDISELSIFGVHAVMFSEETKNGTWLVVVFSVLNPDWNLTVGELTSSFAWTEFFKANALVSVFDTFVSKEDSDFFATAVNTEVNEFWHLVSEDWLRIKIQTVGWLKPLLLFQVIIFFFKPADFIL